MGLLEGFLEPRTSRLQDSMDRRTYNANQDRRADNLDARQEKTLGMLEDKTAKENLQEKSTDYWNQAINRGWVNVKKPLETTTVLVQEVAAGDAIAQDAVKNMLIDNGLFRDGVTPDQITYDPDGQFFSVATKNPEGKDGAATVDGSNADDAEVIRVPLNKIQGYFDLFHGTKVVNNLGDATEARIVENSAKGAYLKEARGLLEQGKNISIEAHRDMVALLQEAGTPDADIEDQKQALELAKKMIETQSSLSENPVADPSYDGAVSLDQLGKLGVDAAQWAAATDEEKAQILDVLNDKRNLGLAGDIAKAAPEASLDFITAPARAGLADIGDSIATSRLGKALGLATPTQEPRSSIEVAQDNPNFISGMTDVRQAASEMERPFTLEQLDSSFGKSNKLAAAQKQLDRFNELETKGKLSPKQKARKRKLEDDLKAGGFDNTNTEANEFLIANSSDKIVAEKAPVVAEAAPEWQKQIEGKSLQEVNQMITDGTVTLSQTEAQNLAKKLDAQGIKNINDLYDARMSTYDKIEALSALAIFTTDPAQRLKIQQATLNLMDGGSITMTPNEIQDNRVAQQNANTTSGRLAQDLRKFSNELATAQQTNFSQGITGLSKIIKDVNAYMFDENTNELTKDPNMVRKLLQQDMVQLNLQSATATNQATADKYAEAKSRLLSIALMSLANSGEGASVIDKLASAFNQDASGGSRKELNNITSDGTTIFYSEADGLGNMREVGMGIPIRTLMGMNAEMTRAILDATEKNAEAAAGT